MLSPEGTTNLFNQIHQFWIEPELSRRRQSGTLSPDFKIFRCLVRLPQDKPAIVEFNDEIPWFVKIQPAPGLAIVKGQDVYLHEINKIVAVDPPSVDGKRVAFVLLFWAGQHYSIIFDFTPNAPDNIVSPSSKANWSYSDILASLLQGLLIEKTILNHDALQRLFQTIGLWPAPALLPFPLSEIAHKLQNNDPPGAVAALVTHCTPTFLQLLAEKWWDCPYFQSRRILLQDALSAHADRKYTLSIHALLPQLEGVITDFVFDQVPHEDVPWRQESKTKKFRALVFASPPTSFAYKRIVDSTIHFILEGPVLDTFKSWLQNIDTTFPNRHVVEHGKFEQMLYSEENSIKLILLLDTVFHIITNRAQLNRHHERANNFA